MFLNSLVSFPNPPLWVVLFPCGKKSLAFSLRPLSPQGLGLGTSLSSTHFHVSCITITYPKVGAAVYLPQGDVERLSARSESKLNQCGCAVRSGHILGDLDTPLRSREAHHDDWGRVARVKGDAGVGCYPTDADQACDPSAKVIHSTGTDPGGVTPSNQCAQCSTGVIALHLC